MYIKLNHSQRIKLFVKMNQMNKSKTNSMNLESNYWQEQRDYFKEKTVAFKELKKRRHIEIMKEELEKEINKNKKIDKD